MKFRFLDEVCKEEGLNTPNFPFLEQDDERYRCVLLQPAGVLNVGADGITNTEAKFDEQCFRFLRHSAVERVDLACCPEYSCPLDALQRAVEHGYQPNPGCLWAIGCQSMNRDDLKTLHRRIRASVIVDQVALDTNKGSFVDPLLFLFRDQDRDQLVCVVQFKTTPMTVKLPLERNNLIRGSHGLIVRNSPTSIRLAALICSDALKFRASDLPDHTRVPYLILHPQLNPEPRHERFVSNRKELFAINNDQIEIICLNWAANTSAVVDGKTVPLTPESHSAIYTKSTKLDDTEKTIQENHERGLYYFRWKDLHSWVFVANSGELCFDIRLTKPSQTDAPPQTASRTGPHSMQTLAWDGVDWKVAIIPDGAASHFAKARLFGNPAFGAIQTQMDLERFVCLAAGDVTSREWSKPNNLNSCQMKGNEEVQRGTCCHYSEGQTAANQRLAHTRMLVDIVERQHGFEALEFEPIRGAALCYTPSRPYQNLSVDEGPVATAAFVGHCNSVDEAQEKQQSLQYNLWRTAEPYYRKLYVWYQLGIDTKCVQDKNRPSITGGPSSPSSITEPKRSK